jgi:hypothetical protein
MKNIILFAILSQFMISCVSQRACDKKFPPETRIKDSVVVTYKDSVVEKKKVVLIVKDSIRYTEAVKDSGEMDTKENATYKFKNDKAAVTIQIKDGKVKWNIDIKATEQRFQSRIDSMASEIKIYKERDSLNVSHKEEVKIIQPHIPWYMKLWNGIRDWLAIIGLIFIIYHIGRLAIKQVFIL